MKFKHLYILLIAVCISLIAVSCNDDDSVAPLPTEFKVSTEKMLFLKSASSDVLYVESAQQPEVVTDGSDWISVGTPSFNGDSKRIYAVSVATVDNHEYEDRTATITVRAGANSAQVTVVQSAADGIAVLEKNVTVDANGGDFTITVQSTGSYSVTYPAWISEIPKSRAMSETCMNFTAIRNVTGADRQGEIILTLDADNNITAVVKVTQSSIASATNLNAIEVASKIYAGWNLGNTLEASGGETAWGNPLTSKTLIDGVKAAGFNAVRIPCAWNQYLVADEAPFTIKPEWIERVKEVVDYVVANDMYAIINIHWDGGWLEQHANATDKEAVNIKQKALWTQIATAFESYGDNLLFAGCNEVRDGNNWGMPDAGNRDALESYNQTFVDAVRATGGNNLSRNLIVQSWCCNPWRALDALTLPNDPVADHLMAEVHFYDPQNFSHHQDNEANQHTLWGYRKGYVTSNDYQEDYIDDLFAKLKTAYVDKGYPIILGEYGTICHSLNDEKIMASQAYYLEYVTMAAKNNGLVPFVWDTGQAGLNSFGIMNRNNGSVSNQSMLNGIMTGAEAGKYPF